jgi:hypothetical protein
LNPPFETQKSNDVLPDYGHFAFASGELFCEGADAFSFGFSFLGFLISRFPFCSPLAMIVCSLERGGSVIARLMVTV